MGSKKLLFAVVLLCASAFAQNNLVPLTPILLGPASGPRLGANLTISFCTSTATLNTCLAGSAYAQAYADSTNSFPITQSINPLKTDSLGNPPAFFAAPGQYSYTVSGPGISAPQGPYQVSVPCIPGSTCVANGNNVNFLTLTAQSTNNVLQVGSGSGQYSSLAACIAALPSTGGTCQIAPGWAETWAANLQLTKNNTGFQFMGPFSITAGTNQITCSTGALTSIFIKGQSPNGGLNQTGFGNTGSFAFGSNSGVFKYTGNGAFISCGDATGAKTSVELENFGIDLTGAGSSAIGVDATIWQLGGWIRGLGILGTGSAGSQVGIQLDSSGGNNPFNWSIIDNQIVNPGTGIVLNATAQEIAMRGNQIIGTTGAGCNTGVATSGIGIWWTGGDIDGCTTTVAFAGSAAESDFSVVSNPSVFTFGASTQDNSVRYLGTATPTVTNSGAVSNLLTWRGLKFGGYDIVVVSPNFTTTSTSLVPITGLTWVLPATQAAHEYHYSCDFSYQQATATGGVEFGFSSTATLTFFNVDGFAATSSTAVNTIGAPVSSTTGFTIVQATPANTTGQFGVHMGGAFLVPAAGTTINWEVLTQNASDQVTVFQQSGCTLNP